MRIHATAALVIGCSLFASSAAARALSLDEALRLARAGAMQPRVARAAEQVADAQVTTARAPYLPTLAASVSGTFYRLDGSYFQKGLSTGSQTQTSGYGDAAVDLGWTLYDFGRTGNAVDAAKHAARAAQDDRAAAEQQAMGATAAAYFVLAADDDAVDAAKAMVAQREKMLDVTRGLVASGARSVLERSRAEVAVEVARLESVRAAGKREGDRLALAQAIGLAADATIETTRPSAAPIAIDPRGAAERAAKERPDVLAAEARVASAESTLDASAAGHLPSLAMQGEVHGQDYRVSELEVHGQSLAETAAITLTVPIFDATVNARVGESEAGVGLAKAQRDQAAFDARHQAAQAVVAMRAADAARTEARGLAASAAANLAAIEARYAAGIAGALELLDAQQVDRDARLRAIEAQLAVDLATVRVHAATGHVERVAALSTDSGAR